MANCRFKHNIDMNSQTTNASVQNKTIRAYVIDDISISRELTVAALDQEDALFIIGNASDREQAVRLATMADVALLRAELPTEEAIAIVQSIVDVNSDLKVTVFGLKKSEVAALAFIEAGAIGYVFEGDSLAELVKNIVASSNNRARVSSRMAAYLITRLQELKSLSAQLDHVYQYRHRFEQLTPREQEILELIGEGLTNRGIAQQIFVEAGTVKNHVHNILRKLQVRNRKDAAAFLALSQVETNTPAFG